jgi:hypothetical protein
MRPTQHENHESVGRDFSIDRANRPSKAVTYICGVIAAAVSTVSCGDWQPNGEGNIGSIQQNIYQDSFYQPTVGQSVGTNGYPNVIYTDTTKQNATLFYLTNSEAPAYQYDYWCAFSTDGANTFSGEMKLNDNALTNKINSTFDEGAMAIRLNGSNYDFYFISSDGDVKVSSNFDVNNCIATQEPVTLPSTTGTINEYHTTDSISINPLLNDTLSSIQGSGSNSKLYTVDFTTGVQTAVSFPSSLIGGGVTDGLTGISFGPDFYIIGSTIGPNSQGESDLYYVKAGVATNLNLVPTMLATPNDANRQLTPYIDEKGILWYSNGPTGSETLKRLDPIPTGAAGSAGATSTGGTGGATGGTGGLTGGTGGLTGGTGGSTGGTGGLAGAPSTGGSAGEVPTGGTGGGVTGGTGGGILTGGTGGGIPTGGTGGGILTGGTGGIPTGGGAGIETTGGSGGSTGGTGGSILTTGGTGGSIETSPLTLNSATNCEVLTDGATVIGLKFTGDGTCEGSWQTDASLAPSTFVCVNNYNALSSFGINKSTHTIVEDTQGLKCNIVDGEGVNKLIMGTGNAIAAGLDTNYEAGAAEAAKQIMVNGQPDVYYIKSNEGRVQLDMSGVPVQTFNTGEKTYWRRSTLADLGADFTPGTDLPTTTPAPKDSGCGCEFAGAGQNDFGLTWLAVGGFFTLVGRRRKSAKK